MQATAHRHPRTLQPTHEDKVKRFMSAVKDENVRIGGVAITSKYMRRAHSTSFWFVNSSKACEV